MDEDLMHTLVSRSHAKNYWVAAKEELYVKLSHLHHDTWTKDIVLDKRFSDTDRNKIITVMHPIWTSWNRWAHDQEKFHPIQAIKWV